MAIVLKGGCFGLYSGEFVCKEGGCKMSVQCKAFANSDGLDVVSDVVDALLDTLPEQEYFRSDSVKVLVNQIHNPSLVSTLLGNMRKATPPPNALGAPDLSLNTVL